MIPLVGPHITWQDREYVKGRIDEGLLADETEVAALEQAFAARFGYAHAVATNSGTTALIVALETVTVPGDWVLIPSYTCRAVYDAVKGAGCTPILGDNRCDVVGADYHLIADDDHGAPVTVLPHMFGRSPNASAHRGVVIEDVTLSLGSPHPPNNLAVCSLHADKMITAGRGGIILIPDHLTEINGEIRARVSYETHPDDLTPAHSYAMSSLQAALAKSQLGRLGDLVEMRQQTAAYYTHRFTKEGFLCPEGDDGNVFFRYLIGVRDPAQACNDLADKGVEAGRGVYPPIHTLLGGPPMDGADACTGWLLSVPIHPSVRGADAVRIADAVISTCTPA